MQSNPTRRQWLSTTASAISGAWLAGSAPARAAQAPTAPVAVARCKTYNPSELLATISSARGSYRPGPSVTAFATRTAAARSPRSTAA